MNSRLVNLKKKEKPKPSKYQRVKPSPYRGRIKTVAISQ
jgi:hypothetical protein